MLLDLLPQLLSLLLFTPLAMLWGGCCCEGDCVPPPYKLTKCGDPSTVKYTNDDLSVYMGKIIIISGSSNCWTVSCGSGGTPESVTVESVWDTCGDCAVPTGCETCCSASLSGTELTIDFGAGGWTNDACDYCDQLVGEYTLSHVSGCTWQYVENNVCADYVCTSAHNPNIILQIDAQIEYFNPGSPKCEWRIRVRIGPITTTGSNNDGCNANAHYVTDSALPTIADCFATGPWTLNLESSTSFTPCNGSAPSTVTLALSA